MALPFVNIPVPALPGVGAGVDISALPPLLTVLNCFGAQDDYIVLEETFNAGTDWVPCASIPQGPSVLVVQADAAQIRARRLLGSGGAYNLQAAGQGLGHAGNINVAVAANSNVGAGQDISNLGPNLTLLFVGGATPNDLVSAECSLDGANWAPLVGVPGQTVVNIVCGANQLRANRKVSGNAGNFQAYSIPKGIQ